MHTKFKNEDEETDLNFLRIEIVIQVFKKGPFLFSIATEIVEIKSRHAIGTASLTANRTFVLQYIKQMQKI